MTQENLEITNDENQALQRERIFRSFGERLESWQRRWWGGEPQPSNTFIELRNQIKSDNDHPHLGILIARGNISKIISISYYIPQHKNLYTSGYKIGVTKTFIYNEVERTVSSNISITLPEKQGNSDLQTWVWHSDTGIVEFNSARYSDATRIAAPFGPAHNSEDLDGSSDNLKELSDLIETFETHDCEPDDKGWIFRIQGLNPGSEKRFRAEGDK